MRSFVYDSRVIENERQVKFERNAKMFGSMIRTTVKFFAAFFFLVILNLLLNSFSCLAHYGNLFSVSTWHFIEEATRVLFVDNPFATTYLVFQNLICLILALSFTCVLELVSIIKALDNGDEHKQQGERHKREEKLETVNGYSIVSYKNRSAFYLKTE